MFPSFEWSGTDLMLIFVVMTILIPLIAILGDDGKWSRRHHND